MKTLKQKLPRGLTLVEKELEKIIDRYQKEVLSLLFSEKKGFWQKTKYIETVTNTLQIMYSFHVKNKVIFFRFNLSDTIFIYDKNNTETKFSFLDVNKIHSKVEKLLNLA